MVSFNYAPQGENSMHPPLVYRDKNIPFSFLKQWKNIILKQIQSWCKCHQNSSRRRKADRKAIFLQQLLQKQFEKQWDLFIYLFLSSSFILFSHLRFLYASNISGICSISLAVFARLSAAILSHLCPFILVLISFLSGSYGQSPPARRTSLRSLARQRPLMWSGVQAPRFQYPTRLWTAHSCALPTSLSMDNRWDPHAATFSAFVEDDAKYHQSSSKYREEGTLMQQLSLLSWKMMPSTTNQVVSIWRKGPSCSDFLCFRGRCISSFQNTIHIIVNLSNDLEKQ